MSSKIKVGLVQINNSFSGQNYLPYSVGLLQSYILKYAPDADRYDFLLPVYTRKPVPEVVAALISADIVAFSTYVWNIRISLEIAKTLKKAKPGILIIFGGPQVPDRAEIFLRESPFVDVVCHGEGEQVCLDLLAAFPSKAWDAIPGISHLRSDGAFVTHPKGSRIKDFVDLPSPYLDGVFTPLIAANPDEKWLILWETNRGCPFSCTFCDWGSATTSKVYSFELERLYKEVEWFADHRIEFIFCCDANFGILQRDLDLARYVAEVKKKRGFPHALSVQNTKNATERAYQVQKLLSDAGLNKGVTLSLQSVDPETLESIKRQNISSASYQELQRRFTRDRVETYTDMILGLPGETYRSFTHGVSDVITNGQHNRIQFNNLSILPNAEMGNPEYQKKYGMITVQSEIINIHGSLERPEHDIPEIQELVIATASMPREEWVKTRAFCWMTALLHFDKILQIPLIVIHETNGVSYSDLVEAFMAVDAPARFPIVCEIRKFFLEKAKDIQEGGPEYCHSEKWLNIWWPADEYIFIKLCVEGKLEAFYREARDLLADFLKNRALSFEPSLLDDAVALNRALIKLPFQKGDTQVATSHNIWDFYRSVLTGTPVALTDRACVNHIRRSGAVFNSWEDWYREGVWYGNKKGAYLYGNDPVESELEGHF